MRGEEVSYLDRPAADELMKLFADEKEAQTGGMRNGYENTDFKIHGEEQ